MATEIKTNLPVKEMKIRITFIEDVLGSSPNNPDIYRDYIAGKSPIVSNFDEEIEAITPEDVNETIEKVSTVFPKIKIKDDDGNVVKEIPFIWDYQLRGFFKAACTALKRSSKTKSSKLSAHKKVIDQNVFIKERKLILKNVNEIVDFSRPLRGSTPKGEITALANSEMICEGAYFECTVITIKTDLLPTIREWLDYGVFNGLGQWRNSGKGRFTWEEIKEEETV